MAIYLPPNLPLNSFIWLQYMYVNFYSYTKYGFFNTLSYLAYPVTGTGSKIWAAVGSTVSEYLPKLTAIERSELPSQVKGLSFHVHAKSEIVREGRADQSRLHWTLPIIKFWNIFCQRYV